MVLDMIAALDAYRCDGKERGNGTGGGLSGGGGDDKQQRDIDDIDQLYQAIFSKDAEADSGGADAAVRIKLLCEWAVSVQRTGVYRALLVVGLLERRRQAVAPAVPYPFQQTLFEYLDTESPVPGESCAAR